MFDINVYVDICSSFDFVMYESIRAFSIAVV